ELVHLVAEGGAAVMIDDGQQHAAEQAGVAQDRLDLLDPLLTAQLPDAPASGPAHGCGHQQGGSRRPGAAVGGVHDAGAGGDRTAGADDGTDVDESRGAGLGERGVDRLEGLRADVDLAFGAEGGAHSFEDEGGGEQGSGGATGQGHGVLTFSAAIRAGDRMTRSTGGQPTAQAPSSMPVT